MSYFAMARRYRPQTFSDVAAQSHITETLKRALAADRVAPAYLFTGPRGSGKTTVARILAKAVNCDAVREGEPCAACEACRSIADGRSMDVLEIDGASNNSVDDVRELRENVGYAASAPGKRKVYIIDEVHMLSTGAFNALLKTLEEPPAHVLFVFATTEPRKVPQTILSRCQRFDFRRLLTEEIRERLERICKKEKVDIDAAALFVVAKRADGSMRDGMSLLDQVISSTSGSIREKQVAEVLGLVREEIYIDLTAAILEHDPVRALELLHAALREGSDPAGFALGLVEHLRNLLLMAVDPKLESSVQLGDAHLERVRELSQRFRTEDILYLLNRAAQVYEDARNLSNPSVVLEAALVELAHFESRVVLREVLERLDGGSDGPSTGSARGGTSRGSARGTSARGGTPGTGGRSGSGSGGSSSGRASGGGESGGSARGRRTTQAPEASARSGNDDDARPLAAGGIYTPPRAQPTPAAVPAAPRTPAAGVGPQCARAGAASLGAEVGNPVAEQLATATATAPRGRLELDAVHARWKEFTRTLGGSKAMLAQCLSDGVPSRLEGSTLEVCFTPAHAFHMNLLEDRATRTELEQQLRLFFGQPLNVRLRQRDAHGVDATRELPAATPEVPVPTPDPPAAAAVSEPRAETVAEPGNEAPAGPTQPDTSEAESSGTPVDAGESAPSNAEAAAPDAAAHGARLTAEDIARSRLGALAEVVQKAPRLRDIVETFDAEILDERQP